ncbi:hypothetical protein NDU88_010248 [Pleurodeles waltl]|uniref:Uncharacterized protein n=1 Tax=Pleurodeles waltl TaxID=8319 RepID=A0AAV7S0S5_PLEWA|nr:hypothetical protein NDU88_010248 [Pleurodeles waltl]
MRLRSSRGGYEEEETFAPFMPPLPDEESLTSPEKRSEECYPSSQEQDLVYGEPAPQGEGHDETVVS